MNGIDLNCDCVHIRKLQIYTQKLVVSKNFGFVWYIRCVRDIQQQQQYEWLIKIIQLS